MTDLTWMEKLSHYTERWAAPRVLQVAGGPWTVATNGKVMVAIKGVAGPYDDGGEPGDTERPLFHHPATGPAVPMDEVREWAGTAPETLDGDTEDPDYRACTKCEGEGEVEENHWCDCEYCTIEDGDLVECDECDGAGYVDRLTVVTPVRAGRVGPALLNLDFVAWALDRLPDAGPVTVQVDDPDKAVYFDTPEWRLLVMPIHTFGIKDNPDYAPPPHPALNLMASVE